MSAAAETRVEADSERTVRRAQSSARLRLDMPEGPPARRRALSLFRTKPAPAHSPQLAPPLPPKLPEPASRYTVGLTPSPPPSPTGRSRRAVSASVAPSPSPLSAGPKDGERRVPSTPMRLFSLPFGGSTRPSPRRSLSSASMSSQDGRPSVERFDERRPSTSDGHSTASVSVSPTLDIGGARTAAATPLSASMAPSLSGGGSRGLALPFGRASRQASFGDLAGEMRRRLDAASHLPVPASDRRPSTSSSHSSAHSVNSSVGDGPSTAATSQAPSRRLSPASLPIAHLDESAESYLGRLQETCAPADVPRMLASTASDLHRDALRLSMGAHRFAGDPLDIALRKLLLACALPRETQQIDRFVEAFARRYDEENPGVLASPDDALVISFSLIMLATDAFSPSTRKSTRMSRADYVRNTGPSVPNIPAVVLETYYDQIVASRFAYFEDEAEPTISLSAPATPSGRVDPYQLIQHSRTADLRVEVDLHISQRSPFSYSGTVPFISADDLHADVVHAPFLPVAVRRGSGDGASRLRVTRAGRLRRKDDTLDGGRKASNRKWREYGVVLSGSQLLFFRDAAWADELGRQMRARQSDAGFVLDSPLTTAPELTLALDDVVACLDLTFTRRPSVFVLAVGSAGRQILFQAADALDLNGWVQSINYAAAFRSAGVRVRGLEPDATMPSPTLSATMPARWALRPAKSSTLDLLGLDSPAATDDFGRAVESASPSASPSLLLPDSTSWQRSLSSASMTMSLSSDPRLPGSTTRPEAIRQRVGELDAEIVERSGALQDDLRTARHLALLTPFRPATRQRIEAAVVDLAWRCRVARLTLARLHAHREMLRRDLKATPVPRARTRPVRAFSDLPASPTSPSSARPSSPASTVPVL